MNDCRKRKEIADMETVLKAPMNSTMLINSYEVVSYAVWFVKMKDCTASFKEAKIFHVSNVTLNSQDSKFRVGRFQLQVLSVGFLNIWSPNLHKMPRGSIGLCLKLLHAEFQSRKLKLKRWRMWILYRP
uniref:Uncharacterized protein n=1 Tax=Populus trichocarpa TaxID=3694 RepID=A0A3N7F1U6_POPTR